MPSGKFQTIARAFAGPALGAMANPQVAMATASINRTTQVPPRTAPRSHNISMQLTHFGHSCLLASFGETDVLFDPGVFSHGFEGITGLSAILITHQHPDHADIERLPALLDGNPQAALYADPQTAARDISARLGLQKALTPLRLRGMSAMLGRIKRKVAATSRLEA